MFQSRVEKILHLANKINAETKKANEPNNEIPIIIDYAKSFDTGSGVPSGSCITLSKPASPVMAEDDNESLDFHESESSYHPSTSESDSGHELERTVPRLSNTTSVAPMLNVNDIDLPKKKERSQSEWKCNVRKRKRLEGQEYVSKKNKTVQARPMLAPTCTNNKRHKCITYIPEDIRVEIYSDFRNLPDLQSQRNFILQHVTMAAKRRCVVKGDSRKKNTKTYSFKVFGEKRNVCREFFLRTLNITEGMVRGAFAKVASTGVLGPDRRGNKVPPNKLDAEREAFIRHHIASFPIMSSHYCRKSSSKKYLEAGLNISMMYRMYKEKCNEQQVGKVSFEKYRRIFHEYNISFHVPKKDLCKTCVVFKELNQNEKEKQQLLYNEHLKRKENARKHRDEDKSSAKDDPSILAFNFDLQAVLYTPKAAAGQFFYVRKLAVYNLTVYNLGNASVQCFTWDETQGKRGRIEISSCVYKFILSNPEVRHVKMMSDGCGGQQKNSIFCSMLLQLVKDHKNIEIIDHKYFESGHSEMECDSVHSKIERKAKNMPVFVPDGWTQIMRLARQNPTPFEVTTLLFDDFLNFKDVSTARRKFNLGMDGNRKINFRNIVWFRYCKSRPDVIFFKTGFDDEEFKEIDVRFSRGRPSTHIVPPAYTNVISISLAKKKDLSKLCKDLLIPKCYHPFYDSLKAEASVTDRLPEPDAEEDSDVEVV